MKLKNIYIKVLLPVMMLFIIGTGVKAQEKALIITGTVSDAEGRPLEDVKIGTVGGQAKAVTDASGQYSLIINFEDTKLLFSITGYKSYSALTAGESELNVTLERAETYNLDEKVNLGFNTQRKGDVTGAISTVTGKVLERTPAPNLSMTLSGRLPGLFVRQTSSEPSRAASSMWSRGLSTYGGHQPLLVIDGFTYRDYATDLLEYISAMEVESISLLKDASTQALYGVQGANGVLVINTKRGTQRKVEVEVKIDETVEQASTRLPFIPSGEYVQLKNQAAQNDGLGAYYFFSQKDVNGFVSGENPDLYPNNDWAKMNMKDLSNMQRIGINAYGGNDKSQFFTNVNVMHQDGMWKTDQTKYDPNNDYLWANFRTNVDLKLHNALTVGMNLSGNIKREKVPGSTPNGDTFGQNIYYRMYTLPPYIYGPTTPLVQDPETGEITGGEAVVTQTEPYSAYATINRTGYEIRTNTNIYAQFFAKLDMSFLTKGLSLSGFGGYQTLAVGAMYTGRSFEKWIRTNNYDELEFTRYGSDENTPLAYGKATAYYYNLNFKGILDYHRSFDKHNVSAMAFSFYQNMNRAGEALPYKRLLSGIEAAYNYDERYLLKFDVGYSGTEQYSSENRFTATPAVSAGWVVSNEDFLKDNAIITYLKPRVSIGKAANDLGLGRYVYLDNINIVGGGPLSSYLKYYVNEGQAANPNIKPEISVKQNYAIDLTLWNTVSLSADVFREKMDNMLSGATAKTPTYQGIPLAYYPQTNTGIFENKGYELVADINKQLTKDLSVNLGGWVMYSKNRIVYRDESERAEDYAYRKREEGFPFGQAFGYLVDDHNGNGFFNSREELENSNLVYEIGSPRVGDLKYYDINNDGIINDKDRVPLGHGALPAYIYSFNGGFKYRSIDFNVMFEGIGDYYIINNGVGRTEYNFDGTFSEWHRTAWTAERYANGENITYPALSTKSNSNHEANSFFLEDRSYLRLKNAELGYSFPQNISRVIGASKIRIYLSGQNLLTWHNLLTDEYGPEGDWISIPVYRLYNIGLNIKF
jgi:TonB-linked SusC/RagA family outer membrane protein